MTVVFTIEEKYQNTRPMEDGTLHFLGMNYKFKAFLKKGHNWMFSVGT